MDKQDFRDIFGYVEQLRESLADPLLDEFDANPSAEAKQAALRVATNLGYCRLFGLEAGEADGILPVAEALGAAEALADFLDESITQVTRYPEEWDNTLGEEAEDLTIEILERRMDAWAAHVAISEAALRATLEQEPGLPALLAAQERYQAKTRQLDAQMQTPEVLELLSTVIDTYILENWRALLAEPYSLSLPYWLDGTLEATAKRVEAEVMQSLPGPQAWRKLTSARAAAGRSVWDKLANLPPLLAVAAAIPDLAAVEYDKAQWNSPDKQYFACLFVPKRPSREATLRLVFGRTADQATATELAGKPVRLASIERTITDEGTIAFRLEDLIQAATTRPREELTLLVDGVAWAEAPLEE